jgi:hypothetical protein
LARVSIAMRRCVRTQRQTIGAPGRPSEAAEQSLHRNAALRRQLLGL